MPSLGAQRGARLPRLTQVGTEQLREATKMTPREAKAVEIEALRLYDKHNPEPDRVINAPKDACIRQAKRKLRIPAKRRLPQTS
jgi:hypothetical protein